MDENDDDDDGALVIKMMTIPIVFAHLNAAALISVIDW